MRKPSWPAFMCERDNRPDIMNASDLIKKHCQKLLRAGGRPHMGHRAGAALLHGQARLGAVERLDLALLVEGQDDGVGGRIDIKAHHIAQFLDELGIVGELELTYPVRLQPMRTPDALNRTDADADLSFAIIGAVQCVVSAGGSRWSAPRPARRYPPPAAQPARAASCRATAHRSLPP